MEQPQGGGPALGVADQPEGSDALQPEACEDLPDQPLEVLVVGLGRPVAARLPGGCGRGGDEQAVGVSVVVGGEVLPLPVSRGPAPVQIEQEGDLLVGPEPVGEVHETLPPGGLVDQRLLCHGTPPLPVPAR